MKLTFWYTDENVSDDIPFPIGYTKITYSNHRDAALLAVWWLAPFIYPYHAYRRRLRRLKRWYRMKYNPPPPNLKKDLLDAAIQSIKDENALHSVLPYVRDLQGYQDGLDKQKNS